MNGRRKPEVVFIPYPAIDSFNGKIGAHFTWK